MEHVYSVESIGDLKTVMPESGGSVFVLGHTRPGDGGGGVFHWQALSQRTPDDGIVVVNEAQPKTGRWHRLEADPINVRWFGASGDGTDSSSAIQRALDAAKHGGTVRIPSGTYLVSKPLRLHQGTTLAGDGLFSLLKYVGPKETGCLQSATPHLNCPFNLARMNIEVLSESAWGIDLRGMSFGRFDHLTVHLRKEHTSGFFGPGDGKSPYYNVFTACHVAGTPNSDTNGCFGFNFAYDSGEQTQSANANQVIGGHINNCQVAVACYGTGNVFYGQVFEQGKDGYVFGLPEGRLNDTNKGTVNGVAGCYTEYIKRVIVQEHESCIVNAELTHTTGYETVFHGKSSKNSIVLTTHDGRLESSRSFIHRMIETRE
jgi:hypothetical protein